MHRGSSDWKMKLKKVTTSKAILVYLLSIIALLIPFTLYIAFNGDSEPLVAIIQGVCALATTSVGFYYWKAKAENLHKYKQDENINMNGD